MVSINTENSKQDQKTPDEFIKAVEGHQKRIECLEYMVRSLVKALRTSIDCDHIRQSCSDIGCPGAERRSLIEDAMKLLRS